MPAVWCLLVAVRMEPRRGTPATTVNFPEGCKHLRVYGFFKVQKHVRRRRFGWRRHGRLFFVGPINTAIRHARLVACGAIGVYRGWKTLVMHPDFAKFLLNDVGYGSAPGTEYRPAPLVAPVSIDRCLLCRCFVFRRQKTARGSSTRTRSTRSTAEKRSSRSPPSTSTSSPTYDAAGAPGPAWVLVKQLLMKDKCCRFPPGR